MSRSVHVGRVGFRGRDLTVVLAMAGFSSDQFVSMGITRPRSIKYLRPSVPTIPFALIGHASLAEEEMED